MEATSPSVELLISVISEVAACTQVSVSAITPNTIVLSRSPVTQYVQQSDTQTLLPDTVYFSTALSSVYPYQRRCALKKLFAQNLETNGDGNMSLLSGTVICLCCQIHSSVFSTKYSCEVRKFQFGRAV